MDRPGLGFLFGLLVASAGVVYYTKLQNEATHAKMEAEGRVYGCDWRWAEIEEQGRGSYLRGLFLVPPTPVNLHTGQMELPLPVFRGGYWDRLNRQQRGIA